MTFTNISHRTRVTLLNKVKNRQDDVSWEEFAHYYHHYLYIICRRMHLGHHDSEDIVQQVLLKLWDKLPDFEYNERCRFRGWLCTVTGNAVKDFFRKQNNRSRTQEQLSEDEGTFERCSSPDIEEIAEREWKNYVTTLAFQKVKEQLSAKAVDVFTALRQGRSREDVAREYNLTPDSVSVYKGRVVSALCAQIRALEEEL